MGFKQESDMSRFAVVPEEEWKDGAGGRLEALRASPSGQHRVVGAARVCEDGGKARNCISNNLSSNTLSVCSASQAISSISVFPQSSVLPGSSVVLPPSQTSSH